MENFKKPTLFILDDEPSIIFTIKMFFPRFDVISFTNPTEALENIKRQKKKYDILIVDHKMAGMSGLDFLIEVKKLNMFRVRILLTSSAEKDVLVSVINNGLVNKIIEKPIDMDLLNTLIDEELTLAKSHDEREKDIFMLKSKYDELIEEQRFNYETMIDIHGGLKDVYDRLLECSKDDENTLIFGEFGTGREVVARKLHSMSSKKDKPFIKVNCKTLTDTLLEQELFGFRRSDSSRIEKIGKMTQARGGTLYVEEISDIRGNMQSILLDVMKKGYYNRLGDEKYFNVNFNFIFSSSVDFIDLLKEEKFSRELYDLISKKKISVPPLRERKEDIPQLIDYLIEKYCLIVGIRKQTIDKSAIEKLKEYDWPGNIRELENVIARAVIISNDRKAINSDCFEYLFKSTVGRKNYAEAISIIREEIVKAKLKMSKVEDDILKEVLNYFDDNILTAVSKTNISKNKFYRRVR